MKQPQTVLTSYSIGIALRVLKQLAYMSSGSTPESDSAFRIITMVLEGLLKQGGRA